MNNKRKIQIENWARRQAYETFIRYSVPVFSLSTRLDVTKLYHKCKEANTSFFAEMLYIVSYVLNAIEEFRFRLSDGEVVVYDRVDPSYIVMTDNGAISPCRTEFVANRDAFIAREQRDIANKRREGCGTEVFNLPGINDCFYVSCMPWTDITSVSNPYDYADIDSCSIPRVTWGRYVNENGNMKMTMDIAAHHALLDGEPVCRAFNRMQQILDEIGSE